MARILLVEDNQHNQDLFLTALRHFGHEVTLAEDGAIALELLAADPPDLVLLDLSIPRVDGWTVARRARASAEPRVREVPILALTAHAMRGDRDRALAAGCDAYLSKPVSPRELARQVTRLAREPAAGAA